MKYTMFASFLLKGELKCFGTILLVILILMLLGALPDVASQQKLGVWPERRAGVDCRDSAHPAAPGLSLLIDQQAVQKEAETVMKAVKKAIEYRCTKSRRRLGLATCMPRSAKYTNCRGHTEESA